MMTHFDGDHFQDYDDTDDKIICVVPTAKMSEQIYVASDFYDGGDVFVILDGVL